VTLQDEERERRLGLWRELRAVGPDNVSASTLRELGVYGGAQGIWVDKATTATIATNGSGVTVSLASHRETLP
jgi:putative restriction endonuclease